MRRKIFKGLGRVKQRNEGSVYPFELVETQAPGIACPPRHGDPGKKKVSVFARRLSVVGVWVLYQTS